MTEIHLRGRQDWMTEIEWRKFQAAMYTVANILPLSNSATPTQIAFQGLERTDQ
jgi:hypothetical protein